MAKLLDIDKVLEHLEQSVMFEKLLHKVKKVIWGENKQSNLSHTPQLVNHAIEDIVSKKQTEPQIVYQDKIVEKIVEKRVEVPVEKIIYQDRIVEKRIEVPVEKIIEKKIETIPQWTVGLKQQYDYFQQLKNFPELLPILVQDHQDEQKALLSFMSCSSQWQNIIRVWDKLAEHCKNTQQPIDAERLQFLENTLFLYNLTLSSSQVELRSPKVNDDYDFANHTQVAGAGSSINQILLPTLYSAAGEKVKSALVITG